jgi:hypothetical protein
MSRKLFAALLGIIWCLLCLLAWFINSNHERFWLAVSFGCFGLSVVIPAVLLKTIRVGVLKSPPPGADGYEPIGYWSTVVISIPTTLYGVWLLFK